MAATAEQVTELIDGIVGSSALKYNSIIERGQKALEAYLASGNLTDKEKAKYFADYIANTTAGVINQSIVSATQLAQYNADLAFREDEKTRLYYEGLIANEKYKQEQYVTSNIQTAEYNRIVAEKDAIVADKNLKVDQLSTEAKKRDTLTKEQAKIDNEASLIAAQSTTEGSKKLATDAQKKLYEAQEASFWGHNLAKGADSIAQIMGMLLAEGATPNATFVTAHSKLVSELAKKSNVTLADYTAVK